MHIIERRDIAERWKDIMSSFIARPPRNRGHFTVYVTSGTSGGDPIISVREIDGMPSDAVRLLACFGSLCVRLKYLSAAASDKKSPARRILLLDAVDLDDAARLDEFAPDGLLGSASMVLHAAASMSGPTRADVGSVVLGGERLRDDTRKALTLRFPHARIRSMYNATELGNVSKQWCDYLPPQRYHPAPGIDISIHEPDEDGIGDVLVSAPLFGRERVEHYRTGDLGRFVPDACPCGERVTFEIVGRRGIDYVKLPGAVLRREEWDRVARELRLYDDYRIEVQSRIVGGRARGSVRMQVYRKDGVGTQGLAYEIADRVARAVFVTPTRTYFELSELGVLDSLVVTFVAGPFPQKTKDVRIVEK